jgi:L-lactate dehydrogenase complex protein LldG
VEVAVLTAARDVVMRRIHDALGSSPPAPAEVPRAYRHAGEPVDFDPVERFCEVVADYDATVHRVSADGVVEGLAVACGERGAGRVVVAPGLAVDGLGVEIVPDDPPLCPRDLDAIDGVITGCAVAIAQTGTIVLDSGPLSGRRALTLVPDLHLCVVRADQIVPAVPDAIAAVADAVGEGRPITFVSGPSATADIELNRVQGVHGPRTLDVFVVEG